MNPTVCLKTEVITFNRDDETGIFMLGTATGETHYSRTIIMSAGIGAFEPKKIDVDGIDEI